MDFPDQQASLDDALTLNELLTLPVINVSYDDGIKKLFTEIDGLSLEDKFQRISSAINIQNYHFDLRSFWLLDIIAEVILKGKSNSLSHENLWAMIGWIIFIFNGFRDQKWTHENLLQHITSVSIATAREIQIRDESQSAENSVIQDTSPNIMRASRGSVVSMRSRMKTRSTKTWDRISITSQKKKSKFKVEYGKNISKIKIKVNYSLEDITTIIRIFYDLFASKFQFKILNWSFSNIDQVVTLEWPHPINIPRPLKPTPHKSLPSTPVPKKKDKGKSKKNEKKKNKKTDKELETEIEKLKEPPSWEEDDKVYIPPLQEAIGIGHGFFQELFKEVDGGSKTGKANKSKKEKKQKTGKKK